MSLAPAAPAPRDERADERRGLWLAALAAVLFSAKAIVAKLLYRHGIDAYTLIALRMAMAVPVFAWIAWRESRRAQVPLSRRDWMLLGWLAFLGYYLSSFLDFWGLMYVAASLERLILFLTPTLVLVISALVLGKSIPAGQWWAMGVSYAGIVLVFIENLRLGGSHVAFGSTLIFGAALSYAVYLIISGEIVRRVGATRLVAYVMCGSTLMCLLQYLLVHPPAALLQQVAPVYGWSLVNAVLCTVLPVFLTMAAIERIGAARTSQLSVLGPVSLVFLGAWILDESITLLQLLGTAVVLLGIGILTRPRPLAVDQ